MEPIVFRVDSSGEIGTGHVIRCLTLAKKLREKGYSCFFISKELEGNIIKMIEAQDFNVKLISTEERYSSSTPLEVDLPVHSKWLKSSWVEDAEKTIEALGQISPSWLVVDHYALDYRWESYLRKHCEKILVIDDLADRKHDCDILVDQNQYSNQTTRYKSLVPEKCTLLLGTQYSLLQDDYAVLHKVSTPRSGAGKKILIYFGGSDENNLTGSILSALLNMNFSELEIDIVVSSRNKFLELFKNQEISNNNIRIHTELPSLAKLILRADIAIGAGGATSWERCCLGLPSIVITRAKNQEEISKHLDESGYVTLIGDESEFDNEKKLARALSKAFKESDFEKMSKKCLELVDGLGTERVVGVLTLNQNTDLSIRLARPQDKDFLLELRNENSVRLHSANTDFILPEEHEIWFSNKLRNPDITQIYIIETLAGLPIGQVRFDLEDDAWIISYSLAAFARGKKLSKKMLVLALGEFYRDNTTRAVVGAVKSTNQTSQQILNDLGFTVSSSDGGGMSIGICSNLESWFFDSILDLTVTWLAQGCSVNFTESHLDLPEVDVALYVSYEKLIDKDTLKKHKFNAVVHSSDLPKGKGWSPLTWQILEGKNRIVNTLFEVNESIDGGPILDKNYVEYEGFELLDEIRDRQARAIAELCLKLIENLPEMNQNKIGQKGKDRFYRKRLPNDSKIDPNKSLSEEFNLLRVVDNERYPAFFYHKGHRYIIKIFRDS